MGPACTMYDYFSLVGFIKFLIFYFSILPSAVHGGKRNILNLCYQRKKKKKPGNP